MADHQQVLRQDRREPEEGARLRQAPGIAARTGADSPRRLAPLDLAVAAWRDLLGRDGAIYARLAAPPFVWATALALALPAYAGAWPDGYALLLWPLLESLSIVLLLPTATAWHRLVLLGRDHPRARLRYAFHREEWLYFRQAAWLLVLVLLIGTVAGAVLAFAAYLTGEIETLTNPTVSRGIVQPAVVLLAIGIIAPRFLGLPAAAAGRPIARDTLRAATRRAHPPILLALAIAFLPYVAVERVLSVLLRAIPLVAIVVIEALKLFAIGASLGVLSHAYVRLFGGQLGDAEPE